MDASSTHTSTILDAVNAWGYLEDVVQQQHERIACFGPKTVYGNDWMGVVIWYKQRGPYHYATIGLPGIWALESDTGITLVFGVKSLIFSAPVFNPESYFHHIKYDFALYYDDDASPASEDQRRYAMIYDESQRLKMRRALQEALRRWAEEMRQDSS